MRVLTRVAGLILALACAAPTFAQFGHPLKGTWSGDWGTSKDMRTHVVLEFLWDGKAITGTINPGPNAVPLQKATLDPEAWTIHLEADAKDAAGKVLRYVVDGKLENIGSYNRTITGTWTQGTTKGDLKITRD